MKKDNTGYDLKNLFIGAEGTLGIITAAVLRLVPRPRSIETAFAGIASPEAGLELLGLAQQRAGNDVTSFEIMTRRGVELVLEHASGCRDPLKTPHDWYALIELSSQQRDGPRDVLEGLLAQGLEKGLVIDAAIADSLEQAKAFWRIRELFGEVQRYAGGSIKHDVSVPVAAVRPSSRRPTPPSPRSFPAAGRCHSATSATAISITTSTSRSAPTKTTISSAGTT